MINEALARRYFPGENPTGRRLLLPNGPDPARAISVPVVGVVADLRTADLESAIEPELFLDYRHGNPFAMTVNVRTAGDPLQIAPSIRAKLAAIDPTQALFQVKRLDTALIDSIAPRRMTLTLLAVFAGSALLLGVIGIYGVMAYSVAQRRQEIGVRMALGAARPEVLMMILKQGVPIDCRGGRRRSDFCRRDESSADEPFITTSSPPTPARSRSRASASRDGDRGVQPSCDRGFSGGSCRRAAM